MVGFSRLNTNLVEFQPPNHVDNEQHLYIDEQLSQFEFNLDSVDYNKCVQLQNLDEKISYQWCNGFSVLVIYSMKDTFARKTTYVHLPKPLLNGQFTAAVYESSQDTPSLCFDLILKDGIFVYVTLPVNMILSRTQQRTENWFKVLNPYDFSVRPPQFLFHVNDSFLVVFLKDGGLLGLNRVPLEVLNDFDLQPVLFNDSSYFQSFTRIFSKYDNHNSAVVAASLLNETLLVTLTNDASIKVWDLRTYQLRGQHVLADKNKQVNYGMIGNYITISGSLLFVYMPTGNGLLRIIDLQVSEDNRITFSTLNDNIPLSLSSYSIWSLLDVQCLNSSAVKGSSMNLVLLWKSNTVTKVQILSFDDESFAQYKWIECNNSFLSDLMDDKDLITNGSMEKSLLNLKSHYSVSTYNEGQGILRKNNVLVQLSDPQNQEYLTNFESLLKELHKQNHEPSTLTVLNQEIIVVNSLHMFHHSTYKMNSFIERMFFNIYEAKEPQTQMEQFFQVLHGFSSTISSHVRLTISDKYLDLINGSFDDAITLKDKITSVFQACLKDGFQPLNLSKLLEDLNSIDVISVLDQFLTFDFDTFPNTLIDLLATDLLSTSTVSESLKQVLIILDKFIIDILLVFTIVEMDYAVFGERISTLIKLHFHFSLWLQINQIDSTLAISELFKETSKYGHGVQVQTNEDINAYTSIMVHHLRNLSATEAPILSKAFNKFVLNGKDRSLALLFLHLVIKPYHCSKRLVDEFLYALTLFYCGEYDASLKVFLSQNFAENLSVPEFLRVSSSHTWYKLISAVHNNDTAGFFYELSVLYSKASSFANSLQTIKKCIALDGTRKEQLIQYIDTLIIFGDYKEVLDVLRLEQKVLEPELRKQYYTKLLTDEKCSASFISTLFQQCYEINVIKDSVLLSVEDYKIIASVLSSLVNFSDWRTLKVLFSYRVLNQHERKACEDLYEYVQYGSDEIIKGKCLLLISNVLKTFTDVKDQWFVSSSGHIIKVHDLLNRIPK